MITADIQGLEPGARVEMFELDATMIAGGSLLRFHGYQQVATIWWQGHEYTAWPIKGDGFSKTSEGQQPIPKLSVGNVDGSISSLCILMDDLVGAKLTRHVTLGQYLDEVNFAPVQLPTPAFVGRPSIGTYVAASGLISTAAVDVARYDFDPITHAAKGLLLETASTNSCKYSEQLDNALWVKTSASIEINNASAPAAPTGVGTIPKLKVDTTAASTHQCKQSSIGSYTIGDTIVASIYAAPGEYTQLCWQFTATGMAFSSTRGATFDLVTGVISALGTGITAGMVQMPNGVRRCWISCVATGTGTTSVAAYPASATGTGTGRATLATANGTDGIYIWGAEVKKELSSYIATTSAAATRAADVSTTTAPGNPTADPTQEFPADVWFIEQKTAETNEVVEFELASALDLQGQMLPRRQIIANLCSFTYKGPYCNYTGTGKFDGNDQPVTDPALDTCSKRLSGCTARFGATEVLNFGGFPAAALTQ